MLRLITIRPCAFKAQGGNWRKKLSFLKNNNFWFEKLIENPIKNNEIYLNWVTNTWSTLDSIPNESGVYAIIKDNGLFSTVLYVGQSENLHRRLSDHANNENNQKLEFFIKNCKHNIIIKWAEVPKSQLDGVEEFLCQEYKPICNRISPPGNKEISCNLPI